MCGQNQGKGLGAGTRSEGEAVIWDVSNKTSMKIEDGSDRGW